jgi:hypothetical protein
MHGTLGSITNIARKEKGMIYMFCKKGGVESAWVENSFLLGMLIHWVVTGHQFHAKPYQSWM